MSDSNARPPKVLMLLTSDFVIARYDALRARAPELNIITELPPDGDADVNALFAFKLPAGVAPRLPALQLAASVGAGADGIISAPDLPASAARAGARRAPAAPAAWAWAQHGAIRVDADPPQVPLPSNHGKTARGPRVEKASGA